MNVESVKDHGQQFKKKKKKKKKENKKENRKNILKRYCAEFSSWPYWISRGGCKDSSSCGGLSPRPIWVFLVVFWIKRDVWYFSKLSLAQGHETAVTCIWKRNPEMHMPFCESYRHWTNKNNDLFLRKGRMWHPDLACKASWFSVLYIQNLAMVHWACRSQLRGEQCSRQDTTPCTATMYFP